MGEDYIVPEGGVVRTVSPDSKEPNGVLEENAILDSEKKKVIVAPGFEDVLKSIVKAQQAYASVGITTAQDASVEEGKLADLVILDKNPLTIPSNEIDTIKVLETIKEGNTIFKNN